MAPTTPPTDRPSTRGRAGRRTHYEFPQILRQGRRLDPPAFAFLFALPSFPSGRGRSNGPITAFEAVGFRNSVEFDVATQRCHSVPIVLAAGTDVAQIV